MKSYVLLFSFLTLSLSLSSQIRTPPLSQKQTISQKVGFTEIDIEYCRPLMRGRTIFGDLVPYDKIWRTGANRNSQITFSDKVVIGDYELDKGTYTLFTKPSKTEWKVFFYPYDNGYGVPKDFEETKAIATTSAPTFTLNRTLQNLTIQLDNVTENEAELIIAWERTLLSVPIKFRTKEEILGKVDDLINDHSGDYYMAAKYYLDNNLDLEKAKAFIQKSIELRDQPGGTPKFWIYQLKAEILLANNEKDEALKAASKAMSMAASRGKDDYYVKQISDLLGRLKLSLIHI